MSDSEGERDRVVSEMKEKLRIRLEERASKGEVEEEGWREMKSKRVASQAEKAVILYKRSPLSD